MKPCIALVTGGYSGESVISYRTAETISKHLDPEQYQVYKINIRSDGWWYSTTEGETLSVDKNDFTIQLGGKTIRFDAVFLAMHGTPGEDGKLLGYFDMLGIPYTCCPSATAAITFNKWYATSIARAAGIPVSNAQYFDITSDRKKAVQAIRENLTFPVFVKPNNGGSSIGMSKLLHPDENIDAALELAFQEDTQVLVEEMIQGREFTVGVYRNQKGVQVLPITEVFADAQQPFFDFVAKYQGKSTEVTPATIAPAWAEKLQDMARKIYLVFGCAGVVRIDFIYQEDADTPVMLEVNTIPGQSSASIIPQQVSATGVSLQKFYSELLEMTLFNNPHLRKTV
ncbi:MAG: D-alanine--D-alanine ligase [Bacteroidetes bacterium]|nr:D-alanine--D-alanine ligase [Bacteroidota bacterium]